MNRTLYSFLLIAFFYFIPMDVEANSIRLVNSSPYDLRVVVRGSDGSFLGEMVIKSQNQLTWTDTYSQYGAMGGANARVQQDYRSKTPYTVLWYCMDGTDYAMCDTVSTGALVTSQSCTGARMCKTHKKEKYPYQPQDNYYPQEPEGNFLYTPPPKEPPPSQ